MDDVRYCMDCGHYRRRGFVTREKCYRVLERDIVTSAPTKVFEGDPRTERTSGECGPEGKLFEGSYDAW